AARLWSIPTLSLLRCSANRLPALPSTSSRRNHYYPILHCGASKTYSLLLTPLHSPRNSGRGTTLCSPTIFGDISAVSRFVQSSTKNEDISGHSVAHHRSRLALLRSAAEALVLSPW